MRLSGIQSIVENTLLEFAANPDEEQDEYIELNGLIEPAEGDDETEIIRDSSNSQVQNLK